LHFSQEKVRHNCQEAYTVEQGACCLGSAEQGKSNQNAGEVPAGRESIIPYLNFRNMNSRINRKKKCNNSLLYKRVLS